MVKEHRRFFRSLFLLADILVIEASWGAAYWLRFTSGLIPQTAHQPPDVRLYVLTVALIPFVWAPIFHSLDLYRPRRTTSHRREVVEVVRASTLSVLVLIATSYLVFKTEVSRITLVCFWIFSTGALVGARVLAREVLRFLRRQGFNLRRVLIVGTGELAMALIDRLRCHVELGLQMIGVLARDPRDIPATVCGLPVLGCYQDVLEVVHREGIDQVVLAMPLEDQNWLGELLRTIEPEMVDVRVVPDFLQFSQLRGSVEDFDGLTIVSLRASPLIGWNSVAKRTLDLVVGSLALVLAAPIMGVIALAIKLSDGGPILYRQQRMGLDGRVFQMLKFRSMLVDAEAASGPVWAQAGDPRTTRLGRLLRQMSLDELPQLWNVLRGEMSLAGPRPERPALVERFREEVPRYMLRHKVKAGMTGWAQVHGFRGDTSLEARVAYDLYYIQHWSVWLDLKILWLTLRHGFVNKNAY